MNVCKEIICTGCGACYSLCPKNCICMEENKEGFLYPHIDETKCSMCYLCQSVCPALKDILPNKSEGYPLTYAAVHKNNNILKESSSGGIFTALTDEILKSNGVVFGAIFDKEFNVVHEMAEDEKAVGKMRGSKYVQSSIGDCYRQAKEILESERQVLFTGTPCQIAGLKAFLRKPYSNLYTIDLICHGVPSNKLFHTYIDNMSVKKKIRITEYSFRDKTKWGWGNWGSYIYDKNGKKRKRYFFVSSDYYYSLFFKENNFRECCYNCRFASIPRQGDFTIGDYWNIDNYHNEFDIKAGASLVLLNTEKGKILLDKIESVLNIAVSELKYAICVNKNLVNPTERPASRDQFYRDVNAMGFEEAAQKYCQLRYLKPLIARYVPYNIKKALRSALHKG